MQDLSSLNGMKINIFMSGVAKSEEYFIPQDENKPRFV
jgi:hypothetical protein